MTWFLTREEAEGLLLDVPRNPSWTYEVVANGCGPGWGIMVLDADGMLVTESYSPGDVFPLREKPSPMSEVEYHELERKGLRSRRQGDP